MAIKTVLTALLSLAAFFAGGCSDTGKVTAFQALTQHSKYDCELGSVDNCPRGPGNYTEYRDEREQLLREEANRQQPGNN